MKSKSLTEVLSAEHFLENVIFVLGTGRNGSTLLRSLLDGHPELLVWPFEFSFYTIVFDRWKTLQVDSKVLVKEFLQEFSEELSLFEKDYTGDLGNREYKLNNFNHEKFFNTLSSFENEMCTRSEFLKLLLVSFYKSLNIAHFNLKGAVIVHNQPATDMIYDFPECKLVALIRDPFQTYVSNKEFYFRAAVNTGRDRSSVYRPYAANSRFKSLLETAIAPIVYTYNWFTIHSNYKYFYKMYLEELKDNPEAVMRKLSDYLGIKYFDGMLEATFFGQVHHSNLSSGMAARGKIIKNEKVKHFFLTGYEKYWVGRVLSVVYTKSPDLLESYVANNEEIYKSFCSFIKPMANELPEKTGDMREGLSSSQYLKLRVFRYASSCVSYLVNRYVFLCSGYQKILQSWPQAK